MSPIQIVGIVLVKNEDLFVERAVRNIAPFCDRLILCDHGSKDGTPKILKRLADEFQHAAFHSIDHPSVSHDLLKPFIDTRTWVFAVDGDEIYDREKLNSFRERLRSGEFDQVWRMKGNVLHCEAVSESSFIAKGYMAPPSRSITKLYNFAAISSWDGDTVERLHGGDIIFREGYHAGAKLNFQESLGWDESPLRCLHLCFLRRSSLDAAFMGGADRENIMELYRGGITNALRRLVNRILGRGTSSRWKNDHYRRGVEVEVDTAPFFGR